MVVGSLYGGSLCGGCAMWWLGHCVVGHCVVGHSVVGHCVVGAQCGGYAMVVNVPNPARERGNQTCESWEDRRGRQEKNRMEV